MTLLFCDSFDHYGGADQYVKYESIPYLSQYLIQSLYSGRTGSQWLCRNSSNQWDDRASAYKYFYGTAQEVVVGFALYRATDFFTPSSIMHVGNLGTSHVWVGFNTSEQLYVARQSDSTTLGTAASVFPLAAWSYVEFKAYISDTVGGTIVRVDGVDVIKTGRYADGAPSQDTANGSQVATSIIISGNGGDDRNQGWAIDDLYVLDTNGSVNKDFLGDVTVQSLLPNGVGNYGQWTRTGTDSGANWSQVDENPPNDTDFVSATSGSLRDSYAFADLSGTNTVYGVQQLTKIKKTTSGTRTVRQFSRLSSTDMDLGSSETAMPGGYILMRDIAETKPGGGSWTNTAVNDAEFGIRTVT